MVKTIAVCVDGSDIANTAFEYALNELYKAGDSVLVLYAIEYNATFGTSQAAITKAQEVVTTQDRAADSLTAKYAAILREKSINGKATKISGGKPGEVIVAECTKAGVSHIIIGTRGLGAIQRAILGSVSHYVINHTDVPVTIVPGKK